ncbi:MAG: glutaredoxin [bacterium]
MPKPLIQVYTTAYCPYCDAAKRLLKERKFEFEEIDVSDPSQKTALKERTGWRTVPQIFIDGKMIGGYQELAEMDRKGILAGLHSTDDLPA